MKKLSSKNRQWQKIQREKCLREYHRQKREKKRQKQKREHVDTILSTEQSQSREIKEFVFNQDIDIYLPASRKYLSKICQDIRNSKNKHINLSFVSEKMKLYAAGMLLLYAEIYRKIQTQDTKVTCNYPANKKSEQVLQHILFFQMIGKPERISPEEIREKADYDVNSWEVITGDKFEGAKVFDFLEKVVPSIKQENKVYIAVKEMIGNVVEHAYEEDAPFRPWIVFGRISEQGEIVIVVGDLGETIPYTITSNSLFKEFAARKLKDFYKNTIPKKFGRKDDSKLIHIATRLKESSTLGSHRGIGLKSSIENITDLHGRVLIYSRSGSYDSNLSREERKKQGKNLAGIIHGTIVQISIPLPSGR